MSILGSDIIKLPNIKLIDEYDRRLNYLRISITDRCNLRCLYCVSNDKKPNLPHKEILRYEEILRLVRIGVRLGISKVRVTGGEPLIRKGVYDFLGQLTQIDGLSDVSLTTNGVLLKNNIKKIRSAGIKRINVSMDTLSRKKYHEITGHDMFHQVWEGIKSAQSQGFNPIKINVVALEGINDDELIEIAKLSFSSPLHIRFIEYMPIGTSHLNISKHLLAPEIQERIKVLGELVPVEKGVNDGPAERYKFKGAQGEIGFIHAISKHFCNECNRLRLTASGKLRACLLSDSEEDLKGPLRRGCLDSELADVFLRAVSHKPRNHHLACDQPVMVAGRMSAIGG
ncbi:MAG: GTP 3',8-cyclase [Desulfobacteraceae bacterium Eth-SRB1]|nr:MAG: GTP 3',8-cyclase [Desulfobacteraceae bacterium Eth-SRB1]